VVALDRKLKPAQRLILQRQVELVLSEIDTIASDTRIDERLLYGGA